MLKENVRILGIDDGPFVRGEAVDTCLVGVLMRMDFVIEAIMVDYIPIDGDQATGRIVDFIDRVGRQNLYAVMTEGVTFAGFDVLEPDDVTESTGIPLVSITKGKGDLQSMISALELHGDHGKIDRLKRLNPEKIEIKGAEFTLNMSGIDRKDAVLMASKLMRVGNVPEPVRIADMISSAIVRSRKNIP